MQDKYGINRSSQCAWPWLCPAQQPHCPSEWRPRSSGRGIGGNEAPLFLPWGDVPVRGGTAGPLGHRHLKFLWPQEQSGNLPLATLFVWWIWIGTNRRGSQGRNTVSRDIVEVVAICNGMKQSDPTYAPMIKGNERAMVAVPAVIYDLILLVTLLWSRI